MASTFFKSASLSLLVALFGCSEPASEHSSLENTPGVSLNNVKQHIKTLASDDFQGRGPLTHGEVKTVGYLSEQYEAMGLTGAYNGKFLQPVKMAMVTANQNMQLQVGDLKFKAGNDFTARTEQLQPVIDVRNSDIVFVGYGINAPEYNWNDYENINVEGKTVIVLVNDPGFATQNDALFTGNAMTYYGRWTYKYEEAARQGAKAVFIVHETAPAAYPWGVVESSNTGTKYTLMDNNLNASKLPVMGWLTLNTTEQIFNAAQLNYQNLKQKALSDDFKATALNLTANLSFKNEVSHAKSHNVVAQITGSDAPNEYVVIGAHWDHFGTKQTDSGPKIYNGAVDNASGTAATLEIARIMNQIHQQTPFKRSILFANFTAEETGLIGSQEFATGGVVPTKQMVGLLNIDGMNVLDGTDYILQYGKDLSTLENYLANAAKAQGRVVKMDPRPQNGLFFRSDHFSLAKQGVPSLLFMSLGDTDPDYIAHKYHKEADDYSPQWSLGGVKQDIELIVDIATQLANNGDWPTWTSASDFKAKREQDKPH
ncbi:MULTISPECIES: M28 family metallopeptidase [unclassified Pseudoalteromonas]|uniref:M28 family metallopeptidase n=1 Tax=unclassified Pseudoalteromonas TaxID=194690 RepID=UPI000B6FC866|nr:MULTISPECIES: M28 family metallopeptidase [unclassified Pseudoalteromonas]MAJ40234.1 peptidase M28 [Pseudoalteromonadaceae bacterium]OUX88149.1 MAG: peptidase M28 [Pseudoalteromonas sp. TMED43]MDC9563661.1 M28 family metallopeptidase [Pseudoalteromonas sp. GAB2316C]MDC9568221.1 M28 family metallopeptidase [Pseudoalteromonas sp. GABNB9D]MDC9571570.1 M28 family metallopeptidase [Pseudoalteromonas sp. GABNS16A]